MHSISGSAPLAARCAAGVLERGAAFASCPARPQVEEVPLAGLVHQQHYSNFYHMFSEVAPSVHYVLCKFAGDCAYAPDSRWARRRLPAGFWTAGPGPGAPTGDGSRGEHPEAVTP